MKYRNIYGHTERQAQARCHNLARTLVRALLLSDPTACYLHLDEFLDRLDAFVEQHELDHVMEVISPDMLRKQVKKRRFQLRYQTDNSPNVSDLLSNLKNKLWVQEGAEEQLLDFKNKRVTVYRTRTVD